MNTTQRELKRIFRYDKETGFFTRKKNTSSRGIAGIVAGSKTKAGYIEIYINGERCLAHRVAFLYVLGYLPENHIDHINRKRDDNRWENLREVSVSCNMRNCKLSRNNKSGITGVYFNKKIEKWISQITLENGKTKHLGSFLLLKDAAQTRYDAEVKFGYPDCDINSTAKQYLDSFK